MELSGQWMRASFFYPEGARPRAELLHCVLAMPPCICSGELGDSSPRGTENLEKAVRKWPRALLVLSGEPEWVARTIPLLAHRVQRTRLQSNNSPPVR